MLNYFTYKSCTLKITIYIYKILMQKNVLYIKDKMLCFYIIVFILLNMIKKNLSHKSFKNSKFYTFMRYKLINKLKKVTGFVKLKF